MKYFILRRKMIYTEKVEVEAENWEAAKAMLHDESVEFEQISDDMPFDESIEYISET